ncbi:hypothetical protein F4802DRAFT_567060 [Xylaria palmicola]|nr:hypothetical protein F4802DRAFT_567060 [Xylaria palmicola]
MAPYFKLESMFSSYEKEAFLGTQDDAFELSPVPGEKATFPITKYSISHKVLCALQIALLILNISILSVILSSPPRRCEPAAIPPQRAFSPAQPAVRHISQQIGYNLSQYTGEPRLGLDEAWSSLLRPSILRISEDELEKMNKSSIALRDGSGYIGYLEVHHMLHCVKRLYEYKYPEYYHSVFEDGLLTAEHRDHCLEVLIEGITCNADITPSTYYWKDSRHIKGNRTGSRQCVDWSHLQEWAEERTLRVSSREELLASLVGGDEFGA